MTQRTYFNSDELTMRTQVIDCSPDDAGKFRVTLAETLFHPHGGGQLSDKGSIAGVNVERVILEGDKVIHIADQEVAVGEALIEVSPETRMLHARLHSAGHLISGVVEQMGWYASKGHHWPGEGRVVFEPRGNPQPLTADGVEQTVNRLIANDVPRHLAELDGMRSVCFGDLPMRNCGGTHVRSAGQVGPIKILKLKEKKGQLSIQYDLVS
ncbi:MULTISPECIES: alanyl-tRNA editing protein [Cupriavidus]|uniref:Ser-tRNA(Ala) deacylase AlaX n=2 Tax=Cupriavidus TaxID=106589 RepID=A0A7W4YSP6_9BURK|nr:MULTISPECIES: alanyl-tRNA editing protein [Cupriavidus]MBB3009853.1 Ser-tRNA(Ala) deacylase AlaX [Cupriavidus alkaliphilus]QBY56276.1 alanyl-tRNA editing protein [Cupriavidus oxalaticus]